MKQLASIQVPLAIRCVDPRTALREQDRFAAILCQIPVGTLKNSWALPDGQVDAAKLASTLSNWNYPPPSQSPVASFFKTGSIGEEGPAAELSLIPVVTRTPATGSLTSMAIAACTSRWKNTLLLDGKLLPDLAFYHDIEPQCPALDELGVELATNSQRPKLAQFEQSIACRSYHLLASHKSRSGCPVISSENTAVLLKMIADQHRVLVADLEPPLPSTRETGLLDLDELNFLTVSILESASNLVIAEENTIRGRFMAIQLARSALSIHDELANFVIVMHEVRLGRKNWAESPEPLLRSALSGHLRRTDNFEVIRLPAVDTDSIHERVAPIPSTLTIPLEAAAKRLSDAVGSRLNLPHTPLESSIPVDLAGYLE